MTLPDRDEKLAFETLFKCVMLSLETRTAADIPDAVRAKALRTGASGVSGDRARNRLRSALVVSEVGMSVVLVAAVE